MNINVQLAGYIRCQVGKRGAAPRIDTGFFPNLVTNNGLDMLRTEAQSLHQAFLACHVGSGSTAPDFTDTALENRIAQSTNHDDARAIVVGPPRYSRLIRTWEFGEGDAEGNLTEIGAGTSINARPDYLLTRALIRDGQGDPTSITVLSDEILFVTYEFRLYIPTGDFTGTVDINGQTHNWTARAANADTTSSWRPDGQYRLSSSGNASDVAYEGAIGTINDEPSGANSGTQQVSNASYTAGDYKTRSTMVFAPADANFASETVRSIKADWNCCQAQFEFDPPIPKELTSGGVGKDELSVTVEFSWGRYSP